MIENVECLDIDLQSEVLSDREQTVNGRVQVPEGLGLYEVTWRITQSAGSWGCKSAGVEPLRLRSRCAGRRSAFWIGRDRAALEGITNQIGPLVRTRVSSVGNVST